jgi:hypothetical protein
MYKIKTASIYKISCNVSGNCYIGSTTKTIKNRLYNHVASYKSYSSGKCGYLTSFEIIKNNNYSICLVESLNAISKNDYMTRRNIILKILIIVLIKMFLIVHQKNIIKIINKIKKYYKDNIDRISQYYQGKKQYVKTII